MTITRCRGMDPGGGTGCLLAGGHENRDQPACRNYTVAWCSLCNRWDCAHLTRVEQHESMLERHKRRDQMLQFRAALSRRK